jgi:tRNA pseudouridine55 synthase
MSNRLGRAVRCVESIMPPSVKGGLLNLHKPAGLSSRDVVDIVCRVARTRRVGHAGTLDPLASGVLIVCIDWATRLVPCVQELHKRYRGGFLLGRTSDTDDTTGAVEDVANAVPPTREAILAALRPFVGRILQSPPSHSAVHVGGRRAYQLARQGLAVEIPPREVDVFRIELTGYAYPRLELDITCGSGTYIRSIGRDLGRVLGCGAVMSDLVRSEIGAFHLGAAVAPEDLTPANLAEHLLSPVAAVGHLPRYTCTAEQLIPVRQGRALQITHREIAPPEDPPPRHADGTVAAMEPFVALVDAQGKLAALAEFEAGTSRLRPRQVFPAD